MFRVLILTHGRVAEELLASAREIAEDVDHVSALSLGWDDSFEEAFEKTRRAVGQMQNNDGLLILTDMYGGTPFNVARQFADPGTVEILTGVNLPMVVRLCCMGKNGESSQDPTSLAEAARWLQGKARKSICHYVLPTIAGHADG